MKIDVLYIILRSIFQAERNSCLPYLGNQLTIIEDRCIIYHSDPFPWPTNAIVLIIFEICLLRLKDRCIIYHQNTFFEGIVNDAYYIARSRPSLEDGCIIYYSDLFHKENTMMSTIF